MDLPDLSRGRRGHTMTTIDGQLAVVGGVRSSVTTRYAEQYLYIYLCTISTLCRHNNIYMYNIIHTYTV